jgi:hypothetical protein
MNYYHRLRPGGSLKSQESWELPKKYKFRVLDLLTSSFLVVSFILNKILVFVFLSNFNPFGSWPAILLFLLISVCSDNDA